MLEQTDLGSLNEGSVNRWKRRAGILKASCHEESQVLITWLNSYSQSINWLHRLRLSLYVCMSVVKEEQRETEKLFSQLLNVCAEKWLFILSVTLSCCAASHIAQPPTPTSTSITSHPSLGRYPLFTASTQPFSGLCHLIHADDSRPVIGGVRAAEEFLSMPPPHPLFSICAFLLLPFLFLLPPPVFFLPLLSLLLLATVCAPAQHQQPEVSVVCKAPIWNSMSSCTGKVRAKQSATLPSWDSEFVVCEIYAGCMHLLKSCGWFAS